MSKELLLSISSDFHSAPPPPRCPRARAVPWGRWIIYSKLIPKGVNSHTGSEARPHPYRNVKSVISGVPPSAPPAAAAGAGPCTAAAQPGAFLATRDSSAQGREQSSGQDTGGGGKTLAKREGVWVTAVREGGLRAPSRACRRV